MRTESPSAGGRFALLPALPAALLLGGCLEINTDTVLHADGSVDRAVDQRRSDTPAEVMALGLWKRARHVAGSGFEKFDVSLADYDLAQEGEGVGEEEKPKRFTAWGHFGSVGEIPDHFVLKSDDGAREARLSRRFEQRDHGFVREYLWEETATEIVNLPDTREARRASADNWRKLIVAFFEEYLGEGYDLAGLDAWLAGEAAAWYAEFLDLEFDRKARSSRRVLPLEFGDDEAHEKALAELCARHGLDITGMDDPHGGNGPAEDPVMAFAEAKLLALLRGPGGEAVDPAVIAPVLAAFEKEDDEEGEGTEGGEEGRLEEAWERAQKKVLGADGDALKAHQAVQQRLDGLQGGTYRFTMTVPGTVVATTGTLVADDRVQWKYAGGRAFPYGYPMAVRSLQPEPARQEAALGGAPLTGRGKMLEFVELLAGDADLAAAVRKCAEAGDTAALAEFEESVAAMEDDRPRAARAKRLEALRALLGAKGERKAEEG